MMNKLVLVAVLGSMLGGAVGGAGAYWALKGDASATRRQKVEAEPHAPVTSHRPLEDEDISDAEERLRKLEHRMGLLSRASMQRDDGAGLVPEGESDQGVASSDVADPVFEAAVLDIMDREESRKSEERDTWRSELRAERSRRFATELRNQLGLSEQQQDQMTEVIQAYFQSFQDLRDSPERPVTRRQWTEHSEELRRKLEEGLKSTLTPAQYASYEALDDEDKIGMGWGSGTTRPGSNERREQR